MERKFAQGKHPNSLKALEENRLKGLETIQRNREAKIRTLDLVALFPDEEYNKKNLMSKKYMNIIVENIFKCKKK
jgi:hypothetical protein